jgi:tRNA A37 methylthiotransferase MiaB
MNERDSEEILGMLTGQGYAVAEREEDADVILLNTCWSAPTPRIGPSARWA